MSTIHTCRWRNISRYSHIECLILVNPIRRINMTIATNFAIHSTRRSFIWLADCTTYSFWRDIRLRSSNSSALFSLRSPTSSTSIICLRATLNYIWYLLRINLWDNCISSSTSCCLILLKLISYIVISFDRSSLFSFIFTLNFMLNSWTAEQIRVLRDIVVIIKWL